MRWQEREEEGRLRLAEIVEAEEYDTGQPHANVTVLLTFEDRSLSAEDAAAVGLFMLAGPRNP